MLYVEASEVQARFSELMEKVLAGEEVRFRQGGQEIALRRTDDDLMAKMRRQEADGRLTIPPKFGQRGAYRPVDAIDGGFGGTVEAAIEERDDRR